MTYNILLADNDSEFASGIIQTFQGYGCDVQYMRSAGHLLEMFETNHFHAILVDRRIRQENVFHICKALRTRSAQVVVVVLHADYSPDEQQRCIANGADHCISDPIKLQSLAARVSSLLRRRWSNDHAGLLTCHDLTMDLQTGLVQRNGKQIDLRPMEFVLLEFLLRNQGHLYSCADLWCRVWKRKGPPSETVRAHIATLRKKISTADDTKTVLIKTFVGRGYKLEAPPATQVQRRIAQ